MVRGPSRHPHALPCPAPNPLTDPPSPPCALLRWHKMPCHVPLYPDRVDPKKPSRHPQTTAVEVAHCHWHPVSLDARSDPGAGVLLLHPYIQYNSSLSTSYIDYRVEAMKFKRGQVVCYKTCMYRSSYRKEFFFFFREIGRRRKKKKLKGKNIS